MGETCSNSGWAEREDGGAARDDAEQQALRASLRDRAKPTTQIPLNQVAERVLGLLR